MPKKPTDHILKGNGTFSSVGSPCYFSSAQGIFAVERFPLGFQEKNNMSKGFSQTVVFDFAWVVLKVDGGEEKRKERNLANTTNVAVGLLILVLAYVIYPRNALVGFGVGFLGLYIAIKGLRE